MNQESGFELNFAPPLLKRGQTRRMWAGAFMTAALVVVIEVLRNTSLSVPNPPAFLILIVVYSTFLGGLPSGLLSGILAWLYIAYFFSTAGAPFAYSDENLRRVIVWAGTIPLLVMLVGSLKRKAEEAAVFRELGETLRAEMDHGLKTEEALRLSEGRFRSLIESSSDAIALTDANGTILYVSPSGKAIDGYDSEELIGSNADGLNHPDDLPALAQATAKPGIPSSVIWRRRHRDGSWRWLEGVRTNLLGDPAVRAIVTNYRDITDRKKAEESLRSRESHLASVYNTVADVIFVLRIEGENTYRFSSVNPAFEKVTGLPPDSVIGKLVSDVIPASSLPLVLERYREAIEAKRTVRWEETSDYPNGTLTGEVNVASVFDSDGKPVLLIGAVHDITERRRAEAEIALLNEDLERRIVRRTAQLEAANRELEAFSYSVSHDLRGPLRAIHGFSKILLAEHAAEMNPEARHLLDRVNAGAGQMGMLIDDFLEFSRLGRQALQDREIDLGHVVGDVVAKLRDENPDRKIEFHLGDLPVCHGDPAMVRAVWTNLLSNAVKFTRPRSLARIEVGARTDDKGTVFFVRDNGVGFSMEYADKLFGVFQRLHRAEDFEGTGVGLAIVQRVVERHGGKVWAEAREGEGAMFSFSLGGTNGASGE